MSSIPTTIAVVFDCDDTLARDTTGWLLQQCGVEPKSFFKKAGTLVSNGWDPPLAYLNMILVQSRDGKELEKFRLPFLKSLSNACDGLFFPGTTDLFERLRSCVKQEKRYQEVGIQVKCYIISGGIEEFLSQTQVGKTADAVWASSFEYDEQGRPISIKNVMSFTEKTRYLFCINKGVASQARSMPYIVNTPQPDRGSRTVPFSNMIYVGDGPSDIPSMSLITHFDGHAIGILAERADKVWEVGYGRRSNFTIPTDFREDEIGYKNLKHAVVQVAEGIRRKWEASIGPFPSYG